MKIVFLYDELPLQGLFGGTVGREFFLNNHSSTAPTGLLVRRFTLLQMLEPLWPTVPRRGPEGGLSYLIDFHDSGVIFIGSCLFNREQ
jgi:hypothetical protein